MGGSFSRSNKVAVSNNVNGYNSEGGIQVLANDSIMHPDLPTCHVRPLMSRKKSSQEIPRGEGSGRHRRGTHMCSSVLTPATDDDVMSTQAPVSRIRTYMSRERK